MRPPPLANLCPPKGARLHLLDGTELIELLDLRTQGAEVFQDEGHDIRVKKGERFVTVIIPPKRVDVSLDVQRLWAWQGQRLVLRSRISSGSQRGSTPTGNFTAGPDKYRLHLSRLFNNAPMPWAVEISGNVFIHGFSDVPDDPASHGCIRLPLNEGNPAKFFYDWVDLGTPIHVAQ